MNRRIPDDATRQVEALTSGVRLPLPAMDPQHLAVVAETLAAAVGEVAAGHGEEMRGSGESQITALIEAKLCAHLIEPDHEPTRAEPEIRAMWRQLVRAVARGKETVGHDGTRIELRPDLSIFLTRGHPAFPLVVECKIIDPVRGRTIALYCDEGLARFLSGAYGWATQEAIMLAYVRDGSRPHTALAPPLSKNGGASYGVVTYPEPILRPSLGVVRSVHMRQFRYHGRTPPEDDPGTISLWHVWVSIVPDEA